MAANILIYIHLARLNQQTWREKINAVCDDLYLDVEVSREVLRPDELAKRA